MNSIYRPFLAVGIVFCVCVCIHAQSAQQYLQRPDDWFSSAEGIRVAGNILSWQSLHGSWPKNQSTTQTVFNGDPNTMQGTFDNSATVGELRFLAKVFTITQDKQYEQAFLKGLRHILLAQYPTGGWPQFYPPGTQYNRHITFNDGTMVRLMEFLRDVANLPDYSFVNKDLRKAAQAAFDRGILCILKCQIRVNSRLTVWCAQHDEKDYSPRAGRIYEPVSLSGAESAGILKLLMSLDAPSTEVVSSIKAGAAWFESAKITGLRQNSINGDKIMVTDPNATALWARFYEIETNRPVSQAGMV